MSKKSKLAMPDFVKAKYEQMVKRRDNVAPLGKHRPEFLKLDSMVKEIEEQYNA